MQMYGFNYHFVYYQPSQSSYQYHKLINHLHLSKGRGKALHINSAVHSIIQMTMSNIRQLAKEEHKQGGTERRWMCKSRFSTGRTDVWLLLASKLLIAVDTHTLIHPQSCSTETGGPLTAHNVGLCTTLTCSVLMGWKHRRQLENSETRTEKEKMRPATKSRQTASLSTSRAAGTQQLQDREGSHLIQDSCTCEADAAETQCCFSFLFPLFLTCFFLCFSHLSVILSSPLM